MAATRGTRLHSYVVARDYGFAPNPFFGVCTLATCKPGIRSYAQLGDWVVGTGSRLRGREEHLVYAMRVTGTMTLEQYWADPRFQAKKPNLRGSKKQAFGDNIYSKDPNTGEWLQINSHHSLADGRPNPTNIGADTATDRMLYSEDFIYWGGSGPPLPPRFLGCAPHGASLVAGRGHKSTFPRGLVRNFVDWVRTLEQRGYSGEPEDWSRSP
ncbi:MAG: hypothetical protein ACRD2O_14470 [Terriglobia bacterium]